MKTALTILAAAFAVSAHATTLTWIQGSTTKVEQMIGDCDYTAQAQTGQCVPTTSQTSTRARVLGTDIGASFESEGRVIFLFGDTISPTPDVNYFASDTMATSVSTDPYTIRSGIHDDVRRCASPETWERVTSPDS